jgi:hypothetical protein
MATDLIRAECTGEKLTEDSKNLRGRGQYHCRAAEEGNFGRGGRVLISGKHMDFGALCLMPHKWNGTELIKDKFLKKEPGKAIEETSGC